ncbi:MAG TPA: hypothetical protein VFI23_01080 [Rhizomicrobium sp.]|nr:hypothetical protein [Rhizomicrobium sp.]
MKTRMVLFCAAAMAFAVVGSSPLLAADATTKVLAENDKVQVVDNVAPPGAVSPITSRLGLVAYYVTGGMSERTYADGTKEVVERKTGETFIVTEKRPYSLKNVGKTTIHVVTVRLK